MIIGDNMDNINRLINEYNQLSEDIKLESDQNLKNELQSKLDDLTSKIREELYNEQLRGNNSEDFIRLCGAFDAITTIDDKDKKEVEVVQEDKEEIYTLASTKITSYNGEEIDLSNLSRIDKIKTIYEHTGIEINNQDPEIVKLCELRFEQFLRGCNSYMYIQKYGDNWQQTVEQIYKSTYLATVQKCIANGLNEVDEKNKEKVSYLTDKLEQIETEKKNQVSEIETLKKGIIEIANLNEQIKSMQGKREPREFTSDDLTEPVNEEKPKSR